MAESSPQDDEVRGERSEVDTEDAQEEETTAVSELPLDQVFGILKNQRRRYVLKFMSETDGKASLSDIAEQIAAWENDKPVRQISSSERKRVYVGLYQCHLPKMDSMGIISFNKPRGIIEVGENSESLYRYLDVPEESDDPPWHRYSIGLSILGAGALAAALLIQTSTALPVLDAVVGGLIVVFSAYAVGSMYWLRTNGSETEGSSTASTAPDEAAAAGSSD